MIFAQQKRKENIVEYILYMWQIEELIRANDFDTEKIYNNIIQYYEQPEGKKQEIKQWYDRLVSMMKEEGVKERGHIHLVAHLMDELYELHKNLLQNNDSEYTRMYQNNITNIETLKSKNPDNKTNDIEVALTALYGTALMRMQKKEISKETQDAVKSISNMLNVLAKKFKDYETGKLEL